jgi:hypothetical protein
MKKYILSLCGLCLLCLLCVSCKDDESYAELKKKERKVVKAFLERNPVVLFGANNDTLLNMPKIVEIDQETFEAQDSMTDVSKNEYVLFKNTGVYMQIVRKGKGEKLKSGESTRVICRYWEYNILGDSLMTTNRTPYWIQSPDVIDVSNNSGTFSASFNTDVNKGGAMYITYAPTASNPKRVLNGWVIPLAYVNLSRYTTGEDDLAKVRLIVPHSQGTDKASSAVYPCFYEITYEEMRD